jgi:hypothetical protein
MCDCTSIAASWNVKILLEHFVRYAKYKVPQHSLVFMWSCVINPQYRNLYSVITPIDGMYKFALALRQTCFSYPTRNACVPFCKYDYVV